MSRYITGMKPKPLIPACRVCQTILTAENTSPAFLKRGNNICRHCNQQANNARYYKQRYKIMEKLGMKCQCCGLIDYELLSIDHIFGNGHQEAQNLRGKSYISTLYHMSIQDLTAKYRCLCFNCNYAIGFYGKCPHSFTSKIVPSAWLLHESQMCNRGLTKTHLSKEERSQRKKKLRSIQRFKCKLEWIEAYGGCCIICQEEHPLLLILDHINNNGYLEQYDGVDFYQSLKRLGYPGKGTQLQLMCHNCNAKKEYRQEDRQTNKGLIPEIYLSQNYSISEQHEKELWMEARKLFYLLNH